MKIDLGDNFRDLCKWFAATGAELFAVGGYVRNLLIGLPVSDIDVCAPVSVRRLPDIQNDRYTVTPKAFGLGTVIITQKTDAGSLNYEFTEFRNDNYGRGGAHRPETVAFVHDIKSDAFRRDFTVNALYADISGNVADPTGRGLEDLKAGIIRMTRERVMEEDALRIMRMVRFSSELGFEADEFTFNAAKKNVENLTSISAERIREEFFKILMSDIRYGKKEAVYGGLNLLWRLGALDMIIPGITEGEGFAQSSKYHKYDVMEHMLRACAAAPPDLTVRLSALLHDISKPGAYYEDRNLHRHQKMGAEAAATALKKLRAAKSLTEDVVQLVSLHMFDLDNSAGEKAVIRLIAKLGKQQFIRLCMLREADFIGSGRGAEPKSSEKWRAILNALEERKAPFSRKQLAINGHDIMKELQIPPGKTVGELLEKAHVYALKKTAQNNYQSLIRYVKMIYAGDDADNG